MKKFLTIIILILFVTAWYLLFYTKSKPVSVKVSPAENNLQLFIEPDSGNKFLIDAINSASKDILVEDYLLSDKDTITSIENAKSRGVDVQVLLEEHPFGGSGLNPKTKTDLESHNIKFEWTSSSFALTHEKSLIIDDKELFILSQNLTTSSFTKNREYDIEDTNQNDVNEVKNIFSNDWNRTTFNPSQTDLVISPNTSRPLLTSLIESANKEIDIEVEDIDDPSILSLLSQKSQGEIVNLLTPTLKQVSSNKKAFDELKNSKVNIKTLSSPYIHGKLILIDNQKAYVGSINFSTQSIDENRELGIILNQSDIIETLSQTFAGDWQKAMD
ncbi:MAG TPA: phospholipase D-like domain-containing protein [Patescibacteria group bacterium]|nr:phospholipase D-like domain-containing protein [Patescibacteria group bacterium]